MKTQITKKTHDELRQAFDNGTIVDASKEDLEQYLLANGRAQIKSDENRARNAEMGETLRQLLAARQSQELHSHATRISKIALIISIISLLATLAQTLIGYISVPPAARELNLQSEKIQSEQQLHK